MSSAPISSRMRCILCFDSPFRSETTKNVRQFPRRRINDCKFKPSVINHEMFESHRYQLAGVRSVLFRLSSSNAYEAVHAQERWTRAAMIRRLKMSSRHFAIAMAFIIVVRCGYYARSLVLTNFVDDTIQNHERKARR